MRNRVCKRNCPLHPCCQVLFPQVSSWCLHSFLNHGLSHKDSVHHILTCSAQKRVSCGSIICQLSSLFLQMMLPFLSSLSNPSPPVSPGYIGALWSYFNCHLWANLVCSWLAVRDAIARNKGCQTKVAWTYFLEIIFRIFADYDFLSICSTSRDVESIWSAEDLHFFPVVPHEPKCATN